MSLGLSDVIPKSKFCVKTLLVFCNKLQLKLPKVLRRVHLSLTNSGQWRRKCSLDSTSFPQLYSGFNVSWKPCLNFCSFKWLKPSLILVIRQIPLGLWQLQTEFGDGRRSLRILLLKPEKSSDFLRWGSRLFHSVMVDEKKKFLKKLCFVLTRGILYIFRVEYNEHLVEIKLTRYLGFSFSRSYKKGKAFYTSIDLAVTPIPILDRFSLLTYSSLLLLRLGMHYIE